MLQVLSLDSFLQAVGGGGGGEVKGQEQSRRPEGLRHSRGFLLNMKVPILVLLSKCGMGGLVVDRWL